MRRTRISTLLVFFALVGLCATLLGATFILINIPNEAAESFGEPTPNLNPGEVIYLSLVLIYQDQDLLQPANPFGEAIPFRIDLGESPRSVANRLQQSGAIRNAGAFRSFLIYAGLDSRIQAGEYLINPAISAVEIARQLLDATPAEVEFTVLAGWRIEEIAAALPFSGLAVDPEAFINAAIDQTGEGYLRPGRYTIARQISAHELVDLLTLNYENDIPADIWSGINQQGLSFDETINLASIVEREAVVEDEMPLIASVFLNRLAVGIKLDADPTVQYALGYNTQQQTWWTNPLSGADLQVGSAYNTYLYPGLPPTPICNPSLEAIRAVALPAETPYYYFRAACDGSGRHLFAETFEEHVGNACP